MEIWFNKWLNKQSIRWWFETPSHPLWRHCNVHEWLFHRNYNVTVMSENDARYSMSMPWSPWWRHQMETFFALLGLCAGNSPVPVNSPHKDQSREALMFSSISACINAWVNNREAGDLRRHRGHYDVIVMHHTNLTSVSTWVCPDPQRTRSMSVIWCLLMINHCFSHNVLQSHASRLPDNVSCVVNGSWSTCDFINTINFGCNGPHILILHTQSQRKYITVSR